MGDFQRTSSVQSILDSDTESLGSLQYLDIEELDEIEYALPASEAPTLAEVLSTEDEGEEENEKIVIKDTSDNEPATCSALQADFLLGVSSQLLQSQNRTQVGVATALSVGADTKVTVGTAHGHLLSFHEQTLRWFCNKNTDRGAVTCLTYNHDSTRLLVGFARALVCQYESIRGVILRRITLGGEIWGTLRVAWAGNSGLALDTGGSVWLIKFKRTLGVRSAQTSCLFSGARGEVVAMSPKNARILALATLSRVIIVAGGRASGLRLTGPPDTLPVLEWSETDDNVLVCGRANTLQWLSLNITGNNIIFKPIKIVELSTSLLWLCWLGGNLAIFDADENLRLWGDEYEKPLELSHVEPVYATAFFKGHWTDGRVSGAMRTAGVSALGGACVFEGVLYMLGLRGVVRVRPRHLLARAEAFLSSGRYLNALRLLCSTHGEEAKSLANQFIINISERPHVINNKHVADQTVKLCLKYDLTDELWNRLWEQCCNVKAFVEALGDAAVRGELCNTPPSPDCTQALIERLAEVEPCLVERVIASLPLTSLDPHRASVLTREKGLWRAVGAIAAALGGGGGAMRELSAHVSAECGGGGGCECAGWALLVAAADALGGRGAAGRPLPPHAQPAARHDALAALLHAQDGGKSPLRIIVEHDASASIRLLEQSARDPPFVGPLGKQNKLKVAKTLLTFARDLPDVEDRAEVLEFLATQMSVGALPNDQEVISSLRELASLTNCERADRAWLLLLTKTRIEQETLEEQYNIAKERPRVLWHIDTILGRHERTFEDFLKIVPPSSKDLEEFFEYLRSVIETDDEVKRQFEKSLLPLIKLHPGATARLAADHLPDSCVTVLRLAPSDEVIELGKSLLEAGRLGGDAAAAHLKNVCRARPAEVRTFLAENPGLVRPEDALEIVRAEGALDAEPACLEALGDPGGALDAMLRLAERAHGPQAQDWLTRASELCTRTAPALPPPAVTDLWRRLVRASSSHSNRASPALLLEAAAHLPLEELVGGACRDAGAARALASGAWARRAAWRCARRVAARDQHEALARALVAARRAVRVGGRCSRCGGALAGRGAARSGHCGRATHAECAPEAACGACGARVSGAARCPPARAPRPPPAAPAARPLDLVLVAPPRPDLDGVV